MIDDQEIELEPLDDDDLAEVKTLAAEMARTGEDYLLQLHYESEIRRLEQKLADWTRAVAKVENPDDPRLERAIKIMAQLLAELAACRWLYLKTWRPDRRYPN